MQSAANGTGRWTALLVTLMTVAIVRGASIVPIEQQQQQQQLNLTAAAPSCKVAKTGDAVPRYLVDCENLTPDNMDQLSQALVDADTFFDATINYEVSIDYSDLSALTDQFDKHRIGTLWLQWDGLKAVPVDALTFLPTTTTAIYINGNTITNIDMLIGSNLDTVTTLNMADNNVQTVTAGAFQVCTSLATLDLYNNNFGSIDSGLIQGLTSLTELGLSANIIKDIAVDTFADIGSNINAVNLSGNYLSYLTDGAFNGLEKIPNLYLGSNPFICNCDLDWLRLWLQKYKLDQTSGATCVYPTPAPTFSQKTAFTC